MSTKTSDKFRQLELDLFREFEQIQWENVDSGKVASPGYGSSSSASTAIISPLCDEVLASRKQLDGLVEILSNERGVPVDNTIVELDGKTIEVDVEGYALVESFLQYLESPEPDEPAVIIPYEPIECDDFEGDAANVCDSGTKTQSHDVWIHPRTPLTPEEYRKLSDEEEKLYQAAARREKKTPQAEFSAVQKLWINEFHHRGCARGACCVFSMWYHPAWGGHRNCTHKCTISSGDFAHCGPSLLSLDLPPLDYPIDTWGDSSRVEKRTFPAYPEARRRNMRILAAMRKKRYKKIPFTLSLDEARDNDRDEVVASKNECDTTVNRRKRTSRGVSTVQKIRKCMGRRKFGKL